MTLVFPLKDTRVLLGMKQKNFGVGNWNGFGGKIERGETMLQGAVRELEEEAGLKAYEEDLEHGAMLHFIYTEAIHHVSIFRIRQWHGMEMVSDEMVPEWFPVYQLPFDSMWEDDPYWLPQVLSGEFIEGRFLFNEDNKTIKDFSLTRGI